MTRVLLGALVALVGGLVWSWCGIAYGADRGLFGEVSPAVKAWFGSKRIKACCDLADGIPTEFEMRPDGYYVPVPWAQSMVRVPGEALILDQGNPVGRAIIWLNEDSEYIRCFVPGGGV